jgi:hypothetical protein
VAYHGCDHETAERVLSGKAPLQPSQNEYDWLGPGIYFWMDSPDRGMNWAIEQAARPKSKIKKPAVIGAFVAPGLCLNLTDYGVGSELKKAFNALRRLSEASGAPLPENSATENGIFLNRRLDCAVIKVVHQLREDDSLPAYDTVYGVFEEGNPLFVGSAFKEKTHVQIAVRNPDCIIGYFRVA